MAHVGHSLFAHRIDEGLQLLFAKQLEGTLGPSAGDWKAEIALLVSAAYYLLSVLRRDKDGRERTAGMAVMGLQRLPFLPALLPEPRKTLLPLLLMALAYCYQRLRRHALLHRWSARDATPLQQRLHRRLAVLETAAKILGLGHVVATLCVGAFPNILYPLSLIAVGPETVALAGADVAAAAPLSSSSSLSDPSTSTAAAAAAAAVLLPPAFRGLQPLVYVRYHQLLWGSLRGVLFTGILQQARQFARSAQRRAAAALKAWWARLRGARLLGGGPRREGFAWAGPRLAPALAGAAGQGAGEGEGGGGVRAGGRGSILRTEEFQWDSEAGGSSSSSARAPPPASSSSSQPSFEEPCVCCEACPAESPHVPECGHVHCYVCLARKVVGNANASSGNNSSSSAGGSSGGSGGGIGSGGGGGGRSFVLGGLPAEGYSCPVCGGAVSTCVRWVPPLAARS